LREAGLGEWALEVGGVETSIAIVAMCCSKCVFTSVCCEFGWKNEELKMAKGSLLRTEVCGCSR
jgi:hypothetical protein